jgi:chlorite dismutase
MNNRFYTFAGGDAGEWQVIRQDTVVGESLATVSHLAMRNENLAEIPPDARWVLRGVTSNQRYVTRDEQTALAQIQAPLGRPEATCAALIPISKNEAWWKLTQDERREILEERSHHIALGLRYLPQIARQLHHGRDLGEPFDFLTWFEYAPEHSNAFEDLVVTLRATEEWHYVNREIDIRLVRA